MRKVKYNMYKNDILKLVKTLDLRALGMDSIVFIRFLALVEDTFNIEFEYGFMDENKIISVEVLNNIIVEKRVQ